MKYVYALLTSSLLCFSDSHAQRGPILVCNSAGTICSAYTSLDSAYKYAAAGSWLYVPGGAWDFADTIRKEIHLIGNGISSDSTVASGGVTTINQPLTILQTGSNSSIEGVRAPSLRLYAPGGALNCTIEKCWFEGGSPIFISAGSGGILLHACYITTGLTGNNSPASISLLNCIFQGGAVTTNYSAYYNAQIGFLNGAVIKNCLFHVGYDSCASAIGGSAYTDVTNATFKNNIFRRGSFGSLAYSSPGNNNQFYNNLDFPNPAPPTTNTIYPGSSLNANNRGDTSIGHTFTDLLPTCSSYPANNAAIARFLVKVRPTSHGHNAGDDGRDVGVYGGAMPWKEGAIPYNPHVFFRAAGGTTNSSGDLPVIIRVRAEQN